MSKKTTKVFAKAIEALWQTIEARAEEASENSYTAKLLAKGTEHCAKKIGEEGVETALAIVSEDKKAIANESADLLFHWLVGLYKSGLNPNDVGDILKAREGVSGLDEKASRKNKSHKKNA